jgi:hypothetical protein
MTAFLLTQNEAGLFMVTAAFGLGFSGIIPAYVLAVRELFPASEVTAAPSTLERSRRRQYALRRCATRRHVLDDDCNPLSTRWFERLE